MRRLCCQLGMDEEAEDAEAVVHGDDDYIAMREKLSVLAGFGGTSGLEATAVNPDHYGKATLLRIGRSPDVQREAVFARAGIVKDHVCINNRLHAVRAERGRVAHALPFGRRLRRLPAERSDRRSSVGNSFECADFLVRGERSAHFTFVSFYLQRIGCERG